MKKSIKKIIEIIASIMLIVLIMSNIIPTISYAGLKNEANYEASHRPSTSNVGIEDKKPDSSENSPVTVEPNKQSGKVIISEPCTISGNIWEDFKNLDAEIGTYTRNNKLDENEKGTLNKDNIRLEIRKVGNDGVYATPNIGSDGSYQFDATENGEYYVRLYFGKLEDNVEIYNNASKVEKILKYNGQDYMCTKAGNAGEINLDYKYEIITSGKGCTQIYLAIDCSKSMTENKYEGVSRLEAQIKSAKRLVEELIDKNENNIYIGLVAFGEYPYKVQGLTKSKETLNKKLNQLLKDATETDYFVGSTDIRSVIYGIRNNKTKQYTESGLAFKDEEYFVNTDKENSNRYIFLLSDGMPLSDGETVVYNDDSESEIYSKVEKIIGTTREEMKSAAESGIKEAVLITKTDDQEIDEYVKRMCQIDNSNFTAYLARIDTATKTIADKVKENILKTSVEEGKGTETRYLEAGKENSQRREEIEKNYQKTYHYGDTIKFHVLEDYDSSKEEDREAAKEISNTAYCFADTGTYTLYAKGSSWSEEPISGTNPDGSTYTIEYVHVAEENIGGVDIVLTARENFMIEPIIKVTGVKITLADGSILVNELSESSKFIDAELQEGEIRTVENIREPIAYYIDTEIMQNSRIDIEYTIIIKNTSLITSTDIEIGNFIPEGFYMDSEQNMLTVNCTNGDYGWSVINTKALKDNNMMDPDVKNQDCAVLQLSKANGNLIRNSTIGPNGERYVKIVVSKTLPVNIEQSAYIGEVEVLGYSNELGRRMQNEGIISKAGNRIKKLFSIFAGNKKEEDYSEAEDVVIIPPTGLGYSARIEKMIKYALLVILIIVVIILIIIFKKKRKKNKGKNH